MSTPPLSPDTLSRLRRLAENPLFPVATVHCNELLALVECAELMQSMQRVGTLGLTDQWFERRDKTLSKLEAL